MENVEDIYVLKCGIDVITKISNLNGVITAVTIRFGRILYEVSYFYNGEYKSVWLDECEFDSNDDSKIKIGYK